jgi:anti-anti-sigma factor
MTTSTTRVDVRTLASSVYAIAIHGDVTSTSETALMDGYAAASAAGARTIVLDFGAMDYMNSGGIGLLVTLLVRCQRQSQRLAAIGLSDHYREILSLTRLDEAIAIYGSEADVIAAAS